MSDPVNKSDYKADQVLGHDFDGIQEYDNRLPNWWLWILWGSVLFSVGYWLVFHTFGVGKSPVQLYESEMQAAAEAQLAAGGSLDNEALILMSGMPDKVAEGKDIFGTYCVACHLATGGGLVGPNLTDAYWIHGGEPMDMHKTVTEGVLEKGMAAWGKQLGPRRVEAVVAYMLTLRDSNVAGGKAAEGELME
jgi:cytochrome c oxidase cbb3-type subunit III